MWQLESSSLHQVKATCVPSGAKLGSYSIPSYVVRGTDSEGSNSMEVERVSQIPSPANPDSETPRLVQSNRRTRSLVGRGVGRTPESDSRLSSSKATFRSSMCW